MLNRAMSFARDLRVRDPVRFWLVCLALLAGIWKLQAVWLAQPRLFPDSYDYLDLLGPHRTAVADRLPGIPAFFFLLARDRRAIVIAQAFLGAASWGVLACVVARRFRSSVVAFLVGVAVLVFSLTAPVSLWDGVLLSESLSISLLVLLIAAVMMLFERPSTSIVAAAVVLGAIWVYVRDPNAAMLALAAVTMAVLALTRVVSRRTLIVAVAWLLLAASSIALQGASTRWQLALYDIIGVRILTDRHATQEFARAGMPVTPAVKSMAGKLASQGFVSEPALADLRAWTREHGRQTYLRYLLRNYGSTLLDPFRDESCRARLARDIPCFNVLRDGGLAPLEMYPAQHWRSPLPTAFEDALGQRLNMTQYVTALIFCTLAGAVGLWRSRRRANWAWSIWLAAASAVFLVFGWNAESQEVARHTLDVWIYITLGLFLALGTLADAALSTGPDVEPGVEPDAGRLRRTAALRR